MGRYQVRLAAASYDTKTSGNQRLSHAVPPFASRSEVWLSLLEQAGA